MKKRSLDKAYSNEEFLLSPEARPLRILAEYYEPNTRFNRLSIDDTIVVMGSARYIDRERAQRNLEKAREANEGVEAAERDLMTSRYYEDARSLSNRLTHWSKGLPEKHRRFVVCTGGGPGIMEAANRGASEAQGVNVGLSISLPFEEEENPYITRELAFRFHYFFMRKFWFLYLAKAVVFFPGGFGTLDELFEILTLVQTRKVKKHLPLVLYGSDYWNRVVNFDALVEYGTINPGDVDLFRVCDTVDDAFDYLTAELTTYGLAEPAGATL
ncbi:MAG: LOG family protein [Gammaproteobacteria bacterium]|nr:LOG family protein [Gammaproteobacteria bacterium]